MMEVNLFLPEKIVPFIATPKKFNTARGGRGSAKSHSVARILAVEASGEKHRYLCTREYQNSIKDSVHRLICDIIKELGLQKFFQIRQDSIRSSVGSEFIFKGLHNNIREIKSTEGIDRCWVEEAEGVSQSSWDILIPTIRKGNPRFYVVFNPEDENSPTFKMFIKSPMPDSQEIEMNFQDNPWFPQTLRDQMEYDKRVDYEKYEHVWLGKPKKYAHALIFKGKFRSEYFETPPGVQFYYGADWGFSNDPTCLVRMWIRDRKLYIDWEAYAIGIELDDLPEFFSRVPESQRWQIMGDNARPETISHMCRHGYHVEGVEKGKGSVEDGIEFIRSFEEIIIHTRCPNTLSDFNNYKWKVDRLTGLILPVPADGSDHAPDAVRYAVEKIMKNKSSIFSALGD